MPSLNYSFAFDWYNTLNSESVELRRKSIVYGKYGEETVVESKTADITMSIQPIVDTDLLELPEGDRDSIIFKIYTPYVSLLEDDIIVRLGKRYQIKTPPMAWYFNGQLHHNKAFLYKIENES